MEMSEVSGELVMDMKNETILGKGIDKYLLVREGREVMLNYTSFFPPTMAGLAIWDTTR